MKYDIKKISSLFSIKADYVNAEPYGDGHINDTFKVTFNQGGVKINYLFQRINNTIFKNPEKLMENISRVTKHQNKKLIQSNNNEVTRFALTLIESNDGKPYVIDENKNYWRAYIFIENAKTYNIIESEEQAYKVAKAFGNFQSLLVDIPGERLLETIPKFHDTIDRLNQLKDAIKNDRCHRAKDVSNEIDFILSREDDCGILLSLLKNGELPERITHNDTKLNNVMIDNNTNEGICVIDLDTVMPGLIHYDFGDMIRTSTSPAAEDEPDISKVTMQMSMFQALARGYVDSAKGFLTPKEIEMLPFSGKLITLTIAIRFLTDYLNGDKYFKIHRERHNLDRCRTQIALVKSIEQQLNEMKDYIKSLV